MAAAAVGMIEDGAPPVAADSTDRDIAVLERVYCALVAEVKLVRTTTRPHPPAADVPHPPPPTPHTLQGAYLRAVQEWSPPADDTPSLPPSTVSPHQPPVLPKRIRRLGQLRTADGACIVAAAPAAGASDEPASLCSGGGTEVAAAVADVGGLLSRSPLPSPAAFSVPSSPFSVTPAAPLADAPATADAEVGSSWGEVDPVPPGAPIVRVQRSRLGGNTLSPSYTQRLAAARVPRSAAMLAAVPPPMQRWAPARSNLPGSESVALWYLPYVDDDADLRAELTKAEYNLCIRADRRAMAARAVRAAARGFAYSTLLATRGASPAILHTLANYLDPAIRDATAPPAERAPAAPPPPRKRAGSKGKGGGGGAAAGGEATPTPSEVVDLARVTKVSDAVTAEALQLLLRAPPRLPGSSAGAADQLALDDVLVTRVDCGWGGAAGRLLASGTFALAVPPAAGLPPPVRTRAASPEGSSSASSSSSSASASASASASSDAGTTPRRGGGIPPGRVVSSSAFGPPATPVCADLLPHRSMFCRLCLCYACSLHPSTPLADPSALQRRWEATQLPDALHAAASSGGGRTALLFASVATAAAAASSSGRPAKRAAAGSGGGSRRQRRRRGSASGVGGHARGGEGDSAEGEGEGEGDDDGGGGGDGSSDTYGDGELVVEGEGEATGREAAEGEPAEGGIAGDASDSSDLCDGDDGGLALVEEGGGDGSGGGGGVLSPPAGGSGSGGSGAGGGEECALASLSPAPAQLPDALARSEGGAIRAALLACVVRCSVLPGFTLPTTAAAALAAAVSPCGPACYRQTSGGAPPPSAALHASPAFLLEMYLRCAGDACSMAVLLGAPCTAVVAACIAAGSDDRSHGGGEYDGRAPSWVALLTSVAARPLARPARQAESLGRQARMQTRLVAERTAVWAGGKSAPMEGCHHEGPCLRNPHCVCYQNSNACTKFCGCERACPVRWVGCTCRTGCRRSSCPCHVANRECDPDLCTTCRCADVIILSNCAGADRPPRRLRHLASCTAASVPPPAAIAAAVAAAAAARSPVADVLAPTTSLAARVAALAATTDAHTAAALRRAILAQLPLCANVQLQARMHRRTRVGLSSTPNAGCGLFLDDTADVNDLIGEYVGELVSSGEADRRGVLYDMMNVSYLFDLDVRTTVDATTTGNKMRFANHADVPNCAPVVTVARGEYRIGLYATRRLGPHDELYFSYGYRNKVPWQVNPALARKPTMDAAVRALHREASAAAAAAAAAAKASLLRGGARARASGGGGGGGGGGKRVPPRGAAKTTVVGSDSSKEVVAASPPPMLPPSPLPAPLPSPPLEQPPL